jgi:hypothetical protein
MYRTMIFFVYIALMVRAVIVSKRKWLTIGTMAGSWFIALGLAIGYGIFIANGTAAWEMWGIPTFIIPAVTGSLHARSTRRTAMNSER